MTTFRNTVVSHSVLASSRFFVLITLLLVSVGSASAQPPTTSSWIVPADGKWKVTQNHDTNLSKAGVLAGAEKDVIDFRFGFLDTAGVRSIPNEYAFQGSPNFAALPKRIAVEIKKVTGSGKRLITFRFQDTAGTTFQWGCYVQNSPDWQPQHMELQQGKGIFSAWNPKVRDEAGKVIMKTVNETFDVVPPVKFFGLIIEPQTAEDNSSGTISVKGLKLEE
jgi:hypothetical protein